ncbi:hypothetical protein HYX16_03310 [Candidatus Woesearchaeota archaeon]|nr:hypothetical protein [Candidatus Woesearchaeota archaeon]
MNIKFFVISSIILLIVFFYSIFFLNNLEIDIIKEEDDTALDIFCLSNIDFKIKEACYEGNELKIHLLNNQEKIEKFLIQINNKTEKIIVNEELNQLDSKILSININNTKIEKIEIFPIIDYNKKLISCNIPEIYKEVDLCSKKCKEVWICTEWLECINNKQSRNCTDFNECKTDLIRPETERAC